MLEQLASLPPTETVKPSPSLDEVVRSLDDNLEKYRAHKDSRFEATKRNAELRESSLRVGMDLAMVAEILMALPREERDLKLQIWALKNPAVITSLNVYLQRLLHFSENETTLSELREKAKSILRFSSVHKSGAATSAPTREAA